MMGSQNREDNPALGRVVQIATDHLWFAQRYPRRVKAIAKRMRCSEVTAIAIAIADQVCEEFQLTEKVATDDGGDPVVSD